MVALDRLTRGAEQLDGLGSRNSMPSSDTIRRHPRSSVSMASSLRISYRGIVLTNMGP